MLELHRLYGTGMEANLELLENLVPAFETDPVVRRQSLRQAFEAEPVQFLRAFLELVRRGESGPGVDYVASLLNGRRETLEYLTNPVLCSLADAAALAGRMRQTDAALDVKLVKHAQGASDEGLIHLLELLSKISDGTRILPSLMQMLRRDDARIKSKVAFLIGRVNKDAYWVETYLAEADPRIRANVVESLYGHAGGDSIRLLRRAVQDAHHRVAANAWVGLYLAGAPDAADGLIEMARSRQELFQAAAAWGMGRCANPIFLPVLQELSRSTHASVRRCAIRALVAIRKN